MVVVLAIILLCPDHSRFDLLRLAIPELLQLLQLVDLELYLLFGLCCLRAVELISHIGHGLSVILLYFDVGERLV